MPVLNTRKTAPSNGVKSVADIIVRRPRRNINVPMLTEAVVPVGKYRSKIVAIEDSKCSDGKAAVDVVYRFTNAEGNSAEAKVRYPLEGYHIERLFEALLDAGLPEEAPLTDAIGIVEEVVVAYPYDGALGKIKNRRPVASATSSTAPKKTTGTATRVAALEDADEDDDDSEFEDFLEDEDI